MYYSKKIILSAPVKRCSETERLLWRVRQGKRWLSHYACTHTNAYSDCFPDHCSTEQKRTQWKVKKKKKKKKNTVQNWQNHETVWNCLKHRAFPTCNWKSAVPQVLKHQKSLSLYTYADHFIVWHCSKKIFLKILNFNFIYF